MNNSVICEKDYVSVLPRIIDPKMQFTKESIESTIDNKTNNLLISKETKKIIKSEETEINNMSEPKRGITDFISDYKYVILTIVIVMIVIALIYFIYRYYNKKNKKEDIIEAANETLSIESDTKTKAKDDTIKAYLSSYIEDETEDETADESSDDIENINDDTKEIKELLDDNDNNNIIYKSNMPVYNTIIISEPIDYNIQSNNLKNNIDTYDVDDIVEDITDKKVKSIDEYNIDSESNNNIINKIMDAGKDDDIENYDSLLLCFSDKEIRNKYVKKLKIME